MEEKEIMENKKISKKKRKQDIRRRMSYLLAAVLLCFTGVFWVMGDGSESYGKERELTEAEVLEKSEKEAKARGYTFEAPENIEVKSIGYEYNGEYSLEKMASESAITEGAASDSSISETATLAPATPKPEVTKKPQATSTPKPTNKPSVKHDDKKDKESDEGQGGESGKKDVSNGHGGESGKKDVSNGHGGESGKKDVSNGHGGESGKKDKKDLKSNKDKKKKEKVKVKVKVKIKKKVGTDENGMKFVYKPVPAHNVIKHYERYGLINSWIQGRMQRELAYTDKNGMRKVDGRFCVALGSYYCTRIGTKFDLIMKNGNVIPCILADQKADQHTDALHQRGRNGGSVAEFVVDVNKLPANARRAGSVHVIPGFGGEIAKIKIYLGSESSKIKGEC